MADVTIATVLMKIAEHLESNPEVSSYTVDGVTVTRASILDLLEARARLKAEADSVDTSKGPSGPIQYFRRGP